jgi:hypothetical protein
MTLEKSFMTSNTDHDESTQKTSTYEYEYYYEDDEETTKNADIVTSTRQEIPTSTVKEETSTSRSSTIMTTTTKDKASVILTTPTKENVTVIETAEDDFSIENILGLVSTL